MQRTGIIPAMTDRAIPTTEGAPACPFVAFDDDRDARSTAPDHRHRCFAEPVPAPRALAHQDAYCLSPAFAVCPAFQDWARREAAAARPAPSAAAPAPRQREDDSSGQVPMPPAQREPRHAPSSAAQPIPPRKPVARDWAAPPPWAADADADEEAAAGAAEAVDAAPGAIPGWVGGADAGGGAAAARDDRHDASRGLADSAAARLAGPDRDMPAPARPTTSWATASNELDDDGDAYQAGAPTALPPVRPQAPASRQLGSRSPAPGSRAGRPVPAPRTASSRDGGRPADTDAQELFGPAWERPRRYEAYPTLRTRVGLPSFGGVPRLGVAALALVAAAAFLFFIAPMILNFGPGSPAPSAGPSQAASAAPEDTPSPTVAAPTAFVYTVVKGDTLSKIAQQHGLTLNQLLAANPKYKKNPNAIKVGDEITIPAKGSTPSGAVSGASPSAVEGASSAP
jgi:LysM repeat protein